MTLCFVFGRRVQIYLLTDCDSLRASALRAGARQPMSTHVRVTHGCAARPGVGMAVRGTGIGF